MSDHQVVIPLRWRAVFEGADLPVRATDTDVEHAKHDLVRLRDPGRLVLDDFDCFGSWKNCDCLHVVSFHTYIKEQQIYLVRARRFALLSPPHYNYTSGILPKKVQADATLRRYCRAAVRREIFSKKIFPTERVFHSPRFTCFDFRM